MGEWSDFLRKYPITIEAEEFPMEPNLFFFLEIQFSALSTNFSIKRVKGCFKVANIFWLKYKERDEFFSSLEGSIVALGFDTLMVSP